MRRYICIQDYRVNSRDFQKTIRKGEKVNLEGYLAGIDPIITKGSISCVVPWGFEEHFKEVEI